MLGRINTLLSGLSKKDKRRPGSPTRLGESLQSTNSAPAAVLGSAAAAAHAAAAAPSSAADQQQHDAGADVASSNGGGTSAAAPSAAAALKLQQEQLAGHRRSSSDGSLPPPQLHQQTQQPQQTQPCPAPLPQHSNGGSGVLRTNSGSSCSRRASLLSDSGRASRRSSLAQSSDGPLLQLDAMPLGEQQQQIQQLRGDASCVAPPLPLHLLHQRAADSPPPSVAQHHQQQQAGMSSSGASTPDPPHVHHQPQLPLAAAIGAAAASATWSFGMHSEKNQRSAMEDRSQAVDLTGSEAFPGAGRAGFFAVFDGHAGHEAAQYLADHMLGYVLAAGPGALTDNPLAVLGDAVQRAESELVAGNRCAGSTLCALLLVDDKLHVAHVGDSRAVLGRGTEARQLTRDHKPLCRIEAARVAADDPAAEISSDGYIYGEFAVTRAIGSAHFKLDPSKRALIARPDLTTVQLAPEDDFIVVASDGVWDVLPNAEAVSATRRALASVRDAAAAARSLVDRAQRRASSDNISVIMLLLHSRAISMPKSNSMLFRRSQLSSMAAAAGGGGGGGGTGSGGDSPRSYSSTAPCSGTSTPLNMTPRSSTPVLGGTPVRERDGGSGIEPSPAAAAAVAASSPVPAGR